ncbi:MAG TPA: UDP-3-O-(3-hydroxymyristoyl)glucosamine N-acyltransferase [Fontimonas sp.]
MKSYSLQELADRFGLELVGAGETAVVGVCALHPGRPGALAFLSNPKLREQLASTQAGAVIVAARDRDSLRVPGLVAKDPYLAYAHIAQLFDPDRGFVAGIDPRATVAEGAQIGADCRIAAGTVVEAGAVIGAGSNIGPNCVIGRDAQLGAACRLTANVYVGPRVRIGDRCVIQPGAVVGGRGFGNAPSPTGWVEVPQLGTVVVGNDVEIGANTCIDRGAMDDTIIEDGVRLDNLIQIAHNVHIGAHTAIAAMTGIAGSTRIGRRCMIGGAAGIAGHITIADDVILLGRAMVTGSIAAKGVYGSGLPLEDARSWRKTVARIRRLDKLEQRVKTLERSSGASPNDQEDEPNDV